MYNYKFDDNESTVINSHFKGALNSERFYNLTMDIRDKINALPIDYGVIEKLDNYCQSKKSNMQEDAIIYHLIMDEIYSCDELKEINDKKCDGVLKMSELDFQLAVFQGMHSTYLKDGNIPKVLKMQNQIKTLSFEKEKIKSDLDAIKKSKSDRLDDFINKLKNFLSLIKKEKCKYLIESKMDFDDKVLSLYKKYLIANAFEVYLKEINFDDLVCWFERVDTKSILKDNADMVCRVLYYVGTDN